MNHEMQERRTIPEWEREYGVVILDYDGFESVAEAGKDLFEQTFTMTAFERAVASCTVLWTRRQSGASTRTDNRRELLAVRRRMEATAHPSEEAPTRYEPVRNRREPGSPSFDPTVPRTEPGVMGEGAGGGRTAPIAEGGEPLPPSRRRDKRTLGLGRWRRRLLVWFTLPAAAAIAVYAGLRWVKRVFHIGWWWPAALCGAALFVTCVVPTTTLVSGPLCIWYELIRWSTALGVGVVQLAVHGMSGGPAPNWTAEPRFLNQIIVFGNPLPQYFGLSKVVASSVVLGVLCGAAADLSARLGERRLRPQNAQSPDPER